MKQAAKKKVLLIGWDGADWKVINPLMDAGLMPTLKKLVTGGVMGNLASLDPPMSPMLWTSIATGKTADQHGIINFSEPTPDGTNIRPVLSTSRKCKAVWNILMQSGLRTHVVGWWPSHPAEPVNGCYVSNVFDKTKILPMDQDMPPMSPGTVHPERIADTLADLRIRPNELTAEHIRPFVPRMEDVDQTTDRRLGSVMNMLANAGSIQSAATWVMENEPWDFTAVYFDAIDHFCHGFMRYHPPRMENVSEKEFELYKDVVTSAYRFHDMMLERLLDLAGEDTTVILCSDHGFHSDHLRPAVLPREPAGPAHQHRHHGIIVMNGPDIRKDELVFGNSLLDITPTILQLYDLPIGEDMKGRPIIQAFDEASRAIETIESWETVEGDCGMHPKEQLADPWAEQQMMHQLVELGYVDPPDEDQAAAVERTLSESQYYLARVHMHSNQYEPALPLLRQLYARSPENVRYGVGLATCCEALGLTDEALEVAQDIHQWVTGNKPGINLLLGRLHMSRGDNDTAHDYLRQAEQDGEHKSGVHTQIGNVFLQRKDWSEAEKSFRKAVDIDPHNASAHHGLGFSLLRQEEHKGSVQSFLTSVGLQFYSPTTHFFLAGALKQLGYLGKAAEALETCLNQAPRLRVARGQLIGVYAMLGDKEKRQYHLDILKEQKQRREETDNASDTPETDAFLEDAADLNADTWTLDETVVIVSGLPRSGTSLMMNMLQAGGLEAHCDDHRPADAFNQRGYFEHERVKTLQHDNAWVDEARGKGLKVVAPLLEHLPDEQNYRVILLERDMEQVIASQKNLLEGQGKESAVDAQLLAKSYTDQMAQTKAFLQEKENITPMSLDFAEVLAEPEKAARKVNAFLGGILDEAAMPTVVEKKLSKFAT